MKRINKKELKSLIETTNGQFFSLVFVKKDGSDRAMTARTGVSKGVTGKGLKYDPADYGMVCLYDTAAKGHRMVQLDTVKGITVQGETYIVCES